MLAHSCWDFALLLAGQLCTPNFGFFAFLQKRTEEVEIAFELLNCYISLFLSSTVTFWGYLKPRLLSYSPVFSVATKLTMDHFPTPRL